MHCFVLITEKTYTSLYSKFARSLSFSPGGHNDPNYQMPARSPFPLALFAFSSVSRWARSAVATTVVSFAWSSTSLVARLATIKNALVRCADLLSNGICLLEGKRTMERMRVGRDRRSGSNSGSGESSARRGDIIWYVYHLVLFLSNFESLWASQLRKPQHKLPVITGRPTHLFVPPCRPLRPLCSVVLVLIVLVVDVIIVVFFFFFYFSFLFLFASSIKTS